MRSNLHKIKAVIDNYHSYSEMFYGATERIKGIFRPNFIRIKNTIVTKLRTFVKPKENVIQITTKPVDASLGIVGKINDNIIYIKDNITNHLLGSITAEESKIKIVNSFIIFISKLLKEKQVISIKNECDHHIDVIPQIDEAKVYIKNEEFKPNVTVTNSAKTQYIKIDNPSVNGQAWYFVRLEAMTGSLNAYYNQTINDTGRKKAN